MNHSFSWKQLGWITGILLLCMFWPIGHPRVDNATLEALHLVKWYAREHVLLCLIPAFFIAGAVSVFVRQGWIMQYLGARAKKIPAYGMASVSGTLLAVCSCTVLPLFAGIYSRGAGLGPATTFLYSGPAINIMAIILTARVLGPRIGIARAVGAIVFSIIIGLLMHALFRKRDQENTPDIPNHEETPTQRPLWQTGVFFAVMIGILVFANWGKPARAEGLWQIVFAAKWMLTSWLVVGLAVMLVAWLNISVKSILLTAILPVILGFTLPEHPDAAFAAGVIGFSVILYRTPGESREWFEASWTFFRQIMPLLLIGVLAAGLILGRPGKEGLMPAEWVAGVVGGNGVLANLAASVLGSFMYFATLTEVPILEGLLGNGMGQGPALALLLAGPALSLPNMLVIQKVIGTRKTLAFVSLVIMMAMLSGLIYGAWVS